MKANSSDFPAIERARRASQKRLSKIQASSRKTETVAWASTLRDQSQSKRKTSAASKLKVESEESRSNSSRRRVKSAAASISRRPAPDAEKIETDLARALERAVDRQLGRAFAALDRETKRNDRYERYNNRVDSSSFRLDSSSSREWPQRHWVAPGMAKLVREEVEARFHADESARRAQRRRDMMMH